MQICVHKNVLGANAHLIQDSEQKGFTWLDKIPDEAWVFGGTDQSRDLGAACELLGYPLKFPSPAHVKIYQDLGAKGPIPWHKCMPRGQFQRCISDLLGDLSGLLEVFHDTNYMRVFERSREVILGLSQAQIDKGKLGAYLKQDSSSSLRSFLAPKGAELLNPPRYKQANTGRLSVISGPQILTLKRGYRDVITSRFNKGKIVQLDYVSLEPRVALSILGRNAPKDIYSEIQDKLSLKASRTHLKTAVMGALFGISARRLQSVIGSDLDAADVLSKIKDYFGINSLARRLTRELHERELIMNFYGRPVKVDVSSPHILVSYYVQSTGVDVALQGFASILDHIKARQLKMKPIYVLHDALFVDVPEEEQECIDELCQVGSIIPGFENEFFLRGEIVCG